MNEVATKFIAAMLSSNSNSNEWVPKCSCGELICLTSHTKTNPNRKFWKCPNWKDEKGCGRFVWKDEVDDEKNVAVFIKDMKKTMEKLNENICVAVEEMRHAVEERKKSNKLNFFL